MKVILDENGIALPDVLIQSYIDEKIEKQEDIHVSNYLVIDCLRATLLGMHFLNRPQIKWLLYGKEITFNNDLRTLDVFDERTYIWENALCKLIGGEK